MQTVDVAAAYTCLCVVRMQLLVLCGQQTAAQLHHAHRPLDLTHSRDTWVPRSLLSGPFPPSQQTAATWILTRSVNFLLQLHIVTRGTGCALKSRRKTYSRLCCAGARSVADSAAQGPPEASGQLGGEASTGFSSGSPTASHSSRQGSVFARQPSADSASLPALEPEGSLPLPSQQAAASTEDPQPLPVQAAHLKPETSQPDAHLLPPAVWQPSHGDSGSDEQAGQQAADASSVADTDENQAVNGPGQHQPPLLVRVALRAAVPPATMSFKILSLCFSFFGV